MKLTFSLRYGQTDEYLIRLSSVDLKDFLSAEVAESISRRVEVVEIGLERIRGDRISNIRILMQIAEIIAHFFVQNDNVILYFFCDDLNDVERRDMDISPQEFRSVLFSRMFERYAMAHGLYDIENTTICIDSSGWKNFIHFISRDGHKNLIDLLRADINNNYGK